MSNANADDNGNSQPDPDNSSGSDDDLNAKWDAIVAELSDMSDDVTEPPKSGTFNTVIDATAVTKIASGPRDWPTTAEVEALEEADSHFQAPTQIDLGEPVVFVRIAWFVIGLVIVAALVSFGFGRALSSWEILGGTAAIVGAVTMLIRGLPDDREDDPDMGARV